MHLPSLNAFHLFIMIHILHPFLFYISCGNGKKNLFGMHSEAS